MVPQDHPLAAKTAVTLADIAEWPIITYDDGLTGRRRIDQAFETAGLLPISQSPLSMRM